MIEISAGGVVYKEENGELQFLLIEDRYGKRTLAKGKQEPGETLEENALREVWEETGVSGRIIKPLHTVHYQYKHAKTGELVDKEVHYYLIEALSGTLAAQIEEINAVHWRSPADAWRDQVTQGYSNNDHVMKLALHHFGIEV
ncbi:NUDIX hydrolase [Brevibacillus fluminis]|uniref:NUDIX hydrolase n=1 Tax=Brevibacillus fluminis TaxID=511487 RepID=UPI003F890389